MGTRVGSSSSVKQSQFFKIITLPNIEHNELRIPRKFVDEHGKNLNDSVLLKVPSGVKWHVELKKLDGDVWLSNGWKKFADNNFIRTAHLLVFKYKGNSKFDVIIFDMSATEIEYPLNTECIGNEKFADNNFIRTAHLLVFKYKVNSNFNVIIFDMSATEIEYPLNTGCIGKGERDTISKASFKEEIEEFEYVQVVEDSPMKQDIKPTRKIKRFLTEEHGEGTSVFANVKVEAFEKAQAFKSKKPSFMLTLGPTAVSAKAKLGIPATFARRYFKGRSSITLRVIGQKTWSGTCCYDKSRCRVAWRSFTKGNRLKVGDVCVFEMLDDVNLCMNVHIFRAE